MSDYVEKLQGDLKKRLDCLCWMHNEPALHVVDYFAELRREVDLDAERLLSEVQSVKRETGKAPKDSNVNETRLEFIRILQELEKRTGLQPKPQKPASEVYASLEQRINAFKDSSSSLDDLEELYMELARKIIDEIDRVEQRLLGEQTIIYWPHQNKSELGSLVYFGDVFLSRQEIDLLIPLDLSKSKLVIECLPEYNLINFGEASKFFYIGKSLTEKEYSGYSAEGSGVEREFVNYLYRGYNRRLRTLDTNRFDSSINLFDIHSTYYCGLLIMNTRLDSLHSNLLPLQTERLTSLHLKDVHFDESLDTTLLSKFTNLIELKLQVTFSKEVRFELDFLRRLRDLTNLELSLPNMPSDYGALKELTRLTFLKLDGSSFFYAEKLPRLSKAALEQILSLLFLHALELSGFEIEAIDQEILSKCNRALSLILARNNIARAINVRSNVRVRWPNHTIRKVDLIHSDIRVLNSAIFAGLYTLTELSLTGNWIVDLPAGVFQHLSSLDRLHLDKNCIRQIGRGVFDQLRNLRTLKLDDNPIETIEANAFAKLFCLRELSLEGCRLASIDSEMFNGLDRLAELNLSNNLIERIEVVAEDGRRINVAKANLSKDEKQLVEKHLFTDLHLLCRLYLRNNKLEKLDLNCFTNLDSLEELDLASNKINELNEDCGPELLSSLQVIVLNDNQLTTIDQRALPKTLSVLRLSKNRLRRLDEHFFADFRQLRILNLSQNELTLTVTDVTFASCRDILQEIDLSQNESIRATEGAFRQMSDLLDFKCDFSANLPVFKKLLIRSLTPDVLEALQRVDSEKSPCCHKELEVCCISNCSIKSLVRNSEWRNDLKTSEMDRFNLSWLSDASQLRELDFSRNLIETLDDPTLFADFKCINIINLSSNRLSRVNREIFKDLSCLESIDLSCNNLSSIDMGLFRHCWTNMSALNVSANSISFLNLARLFRICPCLESLDVADNKLDDRSTAEPIDARSSAKLQRLSLAGNCLGKMDFVRDMCSLRYLNLRGNRIESVMSNGGENLLGCLRELTHIDLSGNQIHSLTDEMFSHLRCQLKLLDLS